MKKMKIAFDIDGTICENVNVFEKSLATPKQKIIELVKKLKDDGHTIIMFTGRGWPEYEYTKKWLDDNGVPFDILVCGKYTFDVMLCDRSYNINDVQSFEQRIYE